MARTIIGFAGNIGSGKTTAAIELSKRGGFQRIRFAGTLKKMMVAMGLSLEEIDGALKEQPCAMLCGQTPRHAMQTIGTEWGRQLIGEDVWVNAWKRAVDKLFPDAQVVVDDVRFANEAQAIRDMGGVVILVERPVTVEGNAASHASEALDFDVDAVIVNNGTVESFLDQVRYMALAALQPEPEQKAAA